jgi:hypothetical protein
MKMPKFTAEVSLCKMNESYYMNGTNATLINAREVRPQLFFDCFPAGRRGVCCYTNKGLICMPIVE